MALNTQGNAPAPASVPAVRAAPGAAFDHTASEARRARERRAAMCIQRPAGHHDEQWALAFSGGGIRSATFCLGALQGLTQAHLPLPAPNEAAAAPAAEKNRLLPQFDYLSTVSGGGFIGCFFVSLFGANRLNRQAALDNQATARQAYRVFEEDPPGRLSGVDKFDPAVPGKAPLAWLRENGRYMAASGGDRLYAASIAIRNWCAVQCVLGTVFLALYLALAFTHVFIMWGLDALEWHNPVRAYELELLKSLARQDTYLWWSPAWWLLIPLSLLWLLPAGVAYWMTHPPFGKNLSSRPQIGSRASVYAFAVGLLLMICAWVSQQLPQLGSRWEAPTQMLGMAGFILSVGVVWHAVTCSFFGSITAQRVGLSRALSRAMACALGIALFASVHTAAQTLYERYGGLFTWFSTATRMVEVSPGREPSSFGLLGGVAVVLLVWLVRRFASAYQEKQRAGWQAKLPLEWIVAFGAITLLFLVAMFWAQLVVWIQWHGSAPDIFYLENFREHEIVVPVLGVLLLLAIGMAVAIGRFPGFLNLSTFQAYYSARITRAYMGATNGVRFDPAEADRRLRSVAHPVPGDVMSLPEYYANPLAPMHIINVCMNQTVGEADQLVQGDRKGKSLAILPSGFSLDGGHAPMPETQPQAAGLAAALTAGEWVGVSGAAISTGMGRGGDSCRSLLNCLANLRLGRWWESDLFTAYPSRFKRYMRQTFKTQAYLLDELTARFYGTDRPLQYLSDGGHFENMALYELLRPERGIRLIVVCDCGCDPNYQFDDLANLIRLTRIDFGTEVEVDRDIAATRPFDQFFGTPEEFRPESAARHAPGKCALLLNVYHSDGSYRARRPDARVVVIKPRMVPDLPSDLVQYHASHGDFPQQPTADQFYDEAQWESYRKLGMELVKRVFGAGGDVAQRADDDHYAAELWRVLLREKALR